MKDDVIDLPTLLCGVFVTGYFNDNKDEFIFGAIDNFTIHVDHNDHNFYIVVVITIILPLNDNKSQCSNFL